MALWMPMLYFGCSESTPKSTSKTPPSSASSKTLAQADATTSQRTTVPTLGASSADQARAKGPAEQAFVQPPGVEDCEDCHPEIVESYLTTGMGRSMYAPSKAKIIEDFSPKAATIRHEHTGLEYQAYVDDAGRWWQTERLPGTDYSRTLEVAYVVGSGNHTRSYLGWAGGQMVELPLTWYAKRRIWDMSPGYEKPNTLRFTRWVRPECLFCHNDAAPAKRGAPADYLGKIPEGITCTRCHGDGTRHIAAREAGEVPPEGKPDPHIVNPKHLSESHQLQICQQCHLQGAARVLTSKKALHEYTPETPLEDFMSIFEEAQAGGSAFSIASHGHRLSLSACAQGSAQGDKRLVCTTCHDPHRPSNTASHRAACLSCHTPKDCGEAHTAADPEASCAGCHMRKGGTSDIPHVNFTDHFIRKKPSADEAPPQSDGTLADVTSADKRGEKNPLILGLAYSQRWRLFGERDKRHRARMLLLEADKKGEVNFEGLHMLALTNFPSTPYFERMDALEAQARSPHPFWRLDWADRLFKSGDTERALKVMQPGLQYPSVTAFAWRRYGDMLSRLQRFDEADQAYEKAEQIDPYEKLLAQNRATNAMSAGRVEEAEKWLRRAAERDGLNIDVRSYLGELLIQKEDPQQLLKLAQEIKAAQAQDPRWQILQAEGLRQKGDTQGAIKTLDNMHPQLRNGRYWLARGRTLRDAGDIKAAREAAQLGMRFEPGNPALMQLQQSLSGR
ncbi:MAG: tetratricopeptide repeat protein [Bradymonadia bacterium]